MSDEFGKKLREAREKIGLSQCGLAMKIGAASGTALVSLWELGHNKPNRKNLIKLLKFFADKKIDISFLITADDLEDESN